MPATPVGVKASRGREIDRASTVKKGARQAGDRTDWDRDPRPPTGGLAGALEGDPIGQQVHALGIRPQRFVQFPRLALRDHGGGQWYGAMTYKYETDSPATQ